MTPLNYYREQCRSGRIAENAGQLSVITELDRIHHELISEHRKRRQLLARMRKPKLIRGLYVWGGVGIGKTFMMDCFYQTLPFHEKKRIHFHHFMQWIHAELKKHQGQKNPLNIIAKKMAQKTLVICFDEFFVKDIADAMLLARLFHALFAYGVCLVATSNTEPDELYKRGLQRESFLPAIELIKKHTLVLHLSINIDYRLRHLHDAGVFYSPHDEKAQAHLEETFTILTSGHLVYHEPIEICGRLIEVKKHSADVIWFDFSAICSVPRCQKDYIEIAKNYKTVFVSNIPVIPPNAKDTILLFIHLVDVFYDAHTRFIFSAARKVDELYQHGYLQSDFMRTRSRLTEMQSQHYFEQDSFNLP